MSNYVDVSVAVHMFFLIFQSLFLQIMEMNISRLLDTHIQYILLC